MTPQEKARELYNKYGSMLAKDHNFRSIKAIKQCSILAVEEILLSNPTTFIKRHYVDSGGNDTNEEYFEEKSNYSYWLNVKKEIENL